MTSLRAVEHARTTVMLTLLSLSCSLSACNAPYGGARCHAITLQTKPSSLPLGPAVAVPENAFKQIEPFILGTGELACCVANPYFSSSTDCSAVDCEALRARLTVAHVGGAYVNEPCGRPGGVATCNVYLEGDTMVGVRAYCLD